MQYIGSLQAAEKHISAKIFRENLHTSVKILHIRMDLQDSVQRSLQNPAEIILHFCTDSHAKIENMGSPKGPPFNAPGACTTSNCNKLESTLLMNLCSRRENYLDLLIFTQTLLLRD